MPVIDRTDKILQDVLDRITPTRSEQERTQQLVDEVVSATKHAIRGRGLDHVIAGSFTRNTWMKDKKEFDIFIRFPVSVKREDLEKRGLELGVQIARDLGGRHTIAYAEHPYVRARIRNYDVDIVPCYAVSSATRIRSAVDRTPFHNEWLSRHFLKKLSPEVRLLKQFCKGSGVYGSDTRTQGFSGYLCELLIIKYRTFKNLVNKAVSWKAGRTLINLEGIYPVSDMRNMHRKFPGQPLIVIDPVDPGRNVAAALSPANFVWFMRSCQEFIGQPSAEHFFTKPPAPVISRIESSLSKRRTSLMGFSCTAPKVIEDVLWPQLRRTARRICGMLADGGFVVHGHDVWSDGRSCVFFFEMGVHELPKVRKLDGPPIFAITNSSNFLEKYRPLGRVWVEEDSWVAEVDREFTAAPDLLDNALSLSEKGLRKSGIASYLAKQISRSRRMMDRRAMVALARKDKSFGQFLQDYLERDMA